MNPAPAASMPASPAARVAAAIALAVIGWRAVAGVIDEFERLSPARLPRLETFLNASMESRLARTLGDDRPLYDFLRAHVSPGSIVAIYYPSDVTSDAAITMQRLGSLLYPTRVGTQAHVRQLRGLDPRLSRHGVYVLDLDPKWPDAASRRFWKLIASENNLKLWRGRMADL